MESFLDSSFRFLDKETDIELEISKLISEQEKNKWTEIPNYDEVDEEISRLIQSFEEEEKQRKEQGKPSLVSCASPLMSFLLEESEEELSAISNRVECPDVENNIVDNTDSTGQAMKGENLEANNLQIETDKLQSAELELESGSEINIAHSSEASTSNQAAQLQGPSSNTLRKTESTPLSLLKLRISPSPKIVNRLSELKKKNIRGPSKRLTQKPQRPNC